MSRSTMTGASMNVGNQMSDRASTRVRQPPGGGSSISLAWGAPEPAPAARRPSGGAAYAPIAEPVAIAAPAPAAEYAPRFRAAEAAPAAPASAYDMPPRRPSGSAAAPDAGVAGAGAGAPAEVGILPGGGRVSSNAYASGANQNAGNVLTDRRTTRVLAPAGGKSSIVFG